jgi:aspartyl-tRNA(Asn)/glutamyl-tRNA(Gln) amidotransferase subunit A
VTIEAGRLPGSLTEAAAAIARRELSARELVEWHLRRIEAVDPSSTCFVELAPERALERADALDRHELPVGPLHGIPITVKDNIDVAGFPTTAGSPLLETAPAARDADSVGRLLEAGAIVIGKTSMYELAFGAQNERWPAPGNPWRPDRSTAGSSTGSAAAVAARLCLASLATDTGGSIRVPAAFCGLVGLRPSPGRVPRGGLVPLSRLDEIGPITQTATDAAVLFRVLADESGPGRSSPQGIRLAICDLGEIAPEAATAIERLAGVLLEHGARRVSPPKLDLDGAASALWTIAAADAADHWLDRLRAAEQLVHPVVFDRIVAGSKLGPRELEAAHGKAARLALGARRIFERLDALILPVATCVSYGLGARVVETPRGTEQVSAAVTRYTPFATAAGLPALVVPCGFDGDGMPIGAQLIAAPGNEELLFALARSYQAVSSWHEQVP